MVSLERLGVGHECMQREREKSAEGGSFFVCLFVLIKSNFTVSVWASVSSWHGHFRAPHRPLWKYAFRRENAGEIGGGGVGWETSLYSDFNVQMSTQLNGSTHAQ